MDEFIGFSVYCDTQRRVRICMSDNNFIQSSDSLLDPIVVDVDIGCFRRNEYSSECSIARYFRVNSVPSLLICDGWSQRKNYDKGVLVVFGKRFVEIWRPFLIGSMFVEILILRRSFAAMKNTKFCLRKKNRRRQSNRFVKIERLLILRGGFRRLLICLDKQVRRANYRFIFFIRFRPLHLFMFH